MGRHLGIDFWLILVPTWLHFAFQNPPKSYQKSIPRCIKFLIDFCIDFLSILAPTWDPSWGHVGHFFDQNGAALWSSALFFVALVFFFDFSAILTPSWRHFGSIFAPLGPIWARFWRFLVPFWLHVGAKLALSWGTWAQALALDGLVGLREALRINLT